MSTIRFCRECQKNTAHDHYTDIWGDKRRSNMAERLFVGLFTIGASEAMADKVYKCQECGWRSVV